MNISILLTLLNQIRIYHWQTPKHREHVALDTLYNDLNGKIDELVEVYQGKTQTIIKSKDLFKIELTNYTSTEDIIKYFDKFIAYFNDKLIENPEQNGDLVSIKDDVVAMLNKTKYLLSFN